MSYEKKAFVFAVISAVFGVISVVARVLAHSS